MSQFLNDITKVILRDLDVLEKEISLFPTTESIWKLKGDIKNPAGNLALHLCGNLQYYIGAVLGKTGYVRDRPKEFSLKDISAKDLVLEIIKTKEAVRNSLPKLDPSQLHSEYPEKVFADPMTTQYFLIHLAAHLSYHLGQVNYHRRLVLA